MEAMRASIQQIVDDLLDRAERDAAERGEAAPNRRMELIEAFAYPFPVTVISDMLGIPREDRETDPGVDGEPAPRRPPPGPRRWTRRCEQGLREFIAYLKDLFDAQAPEPTDDMISRMVHVEEDGDILDEEEMLATVFLMYLAGHVTTVNLVGNGVVALLTHPEQLAKLKADPELAKNVVEETLRYWGPVDFIGRRIAKEDVEIGGTVIPKGEQVTVSLASANRDPERFAEPDAFDITPSRCQPARRLRQGHPRLSGGAAGPGRGAGRLRDAVPALPGPAAGGARRGDPVGRQLPARVPPGAAAVLRVLMRSHHP